MKVAIELHDLMGICNALGASAMYCTNKEYAETNRYYFKMLDKMIFDKLEEESK